MKHPLQTRPWLSQPVRLPKSLDGFPGIVIDGCAYDFEQAVPRLVYGREEGGFETRPYNNGIVLEFCGKILCRAATQQVGVT